MCNHTYLVCTKMLPTTTIAPPNRTLSAVLLEKGEEVRVQDVHGPLGLARLDDAGYVDLAGPWDATGHSA